MPEAVLPEKDEDETANDEGEDNQGTRYDLPNKHICKEQTVAKSDTFRGLPNHLQKHIRKR